MPQKIYIIGNWKMYLTLPESVELVGVLARKTDISHEKITVIVCPSFPALGVAEQIMRESGSKIQLGAQDVCWEELGAYTGEVSPLDLKELGCRFVIIGHSERRQYLGETDEMIAKKMRTAYGAGVQPILCVGETQHERSSRSVEAVLQQQLSQGLSLVQDVATAQLIVAYEPRWAIGTGTPVEPDEALRIAAVIRTHACSCGFSLERIAVLYGGSVNAENVMSFCSAPSLDGVLVGGASTQKEQFIEIIQKVCGSLSH